MKMLYFVMALILFSCNNRETKKFPILKELTKLEKLMLLPKDSVFVYYDLSDDSLIAMPNLSDYIILSLNLSYNQLDTIITQNLPKKIERLNLAHNHFWGYIKIEEYSIPDLKEIDLSYNKLTDVNIQKPLYRVILSHNDIRDIGLYQRNIEYLDISYNPNLSNRTTSFIPDVIDTIVRKGIANNRRMYNPSGPMGAILFSNTGLAERVMKARDEKFATIYSDSVEYRKVERHHRRN